MIIIGMFFPEFVEGVHHLLEDLPPLFCYGAAIGMLGDPFRVLEFFDDLAVQGLELRNRFLEFLFGFRM